MTIKKVDDHQFRVTWEIGFWADSYEEAAQKAWDTLSMCPEMATLITVEDCDVDEPIKRFDMYEYGKYGRLENIERGKL